MFLIDDRQPERPAPYEPNWRVVAYAIAAIVFLACATSAGGLAGFALICGSVWAGCRAIDAAVGYWDGLREWRQ